MRRILHLEGQKFNRLFILEKVSSSGQAMFLCRCDCGVEKVIRGASLKFGNTKSCGCFNRETIRKRNITHGMSRTPEWNSFRGAMERCTNRKHKDYMLYGGRGIQFKFSSFEQFYSEVGLKPSSKHSLDRINTNGNYEPGNVHWATPKEQANNTRRRDSARVHEELLVAYAYEVMGAY